jgi:hypothetical protein
MLNRLVSMIRSILPDRRRSVETVEGHTAAPAVIHAPMLQMRGCRELLAAHADFLSIRSAIEVIERSIPNDPGLAFTHCRGLLETVCKTILADRGVVTETDANPSRLMSQTLKVLKLTPDSFDGDSRVEEGVADVFRGLNQFTSGIVALRNSQGIGPHGRDAFEAILDADYAIVVAQTTDSAVTLLYSLHRKQAETDPLKRLRFGDFPDFDTHLDNKYSSLAVEETPIQASKALHYQDLEAYRQRLMAFLESPALSSGEEFGEGEELLEDGNG